MEILISAAEAGLIQGDGAHSDAAGALALQAWPQVNKAQMQELK